MDAADIAGEREYIHREESLARMRAARPSGPSRETCEECGGKIPLARREAVPGVRLCINCQTKHEEDA
ncbi:transcriptional regulator, TraR/DksA family [Desulfovibrio sp. X2]|uniref:TraR/DksA C4-type zinc finger protein n=1 Tax=Desulfovibrio sp. X2 TaxID=941449 RepID=UPI000358B79E|nr:TraR/DksA C4-type zinc finger protein [Desulfovibrio sp. X2]EPR43136.1 transcriptional regulator, TraR/DksA family [Desulfovibrio sp. X2]